MPWLRSPKCESERAASLQMDEGVKEIVRMLVRCAYGSPLDTSSKIPSHSARVEVAVRESAFNPLSSPSAAGQPDERIYVAFQQHIVFQVGTLGNSEPCWHVMRLFT